eukprot:g64131.t1
MRTLRIARSPRQGATASKMAFISMASISMASPLAMMAHRPALAMAHRQWLDMTHRRFSDTSVRGRVVVGKSSSSPTSPQDPAAAAAAYDPALIKPRRVRKQAQEEERAKLSELQAEIAAMGRTTVEAADVDHLQVNHVHFTESVLLLPQMTLCWNVTSWSQISKTNLQLLEFIKPRPDLVLIGTGAHCHQLPDVEAWLTSLGILVECMDTPSAGSLFQELSNEEHRLVACALLIDPSEQGVDTEEDEAPEAILRSLRTPTSHAS